jgi:hypothetical protein
MSVLWAGSTKQTHKVDNVIYHLDRLVDGSKANSEMYLILASSTELIMCKRT